MKNIFILITLFLSIEAFTQTRGSNSEFGESSKNRQQKNFQMAFSVSPEINGHLGSIVTQKIKLGHYLDSSSILNFEIGKESGSQFTPFGALAENETLAGYQLGAIWQKFTGNSFHVDLGLRNRSLSYSQIGAPSKSAEANSLEITFKIGNQWQWQSLNFGIDWIGYSLPISTNIKSNTNYSQEKMILQAGLFSLLCLNLGYSF